MSVKNLSQIRKHYHFTDQDARNLQELQSIMRQYKDQLADKFYNTLLEFKETAKFLPNEHTLIKRKDILAVWFMGLFSGVYDSSYFSHIKRIGHAHVKIGLDPQYVNSSMYFVRQFCLEVLEKHFKDPAERLEMMHSVEKILDINLDILSSSYREQELQEVFLSYKLESKLIRLAERFSYGLNLILVLALMGLSLGIIGLLCYDVWRLAHHEIAHGVITTMGALLMLWVMIELMDTEIKHLKQGKFSVNVFVEVVLVAVIRDILIGTLEHGDSSKQIVLVATVLVLGIVYWLISHADVKKALANITH